MRCPKRCFKAKGKSISNPRNGVNFKFKQSEAVEQKVNALISSGELTKSLGLELISDVRLIPIKADVKHTTWAIALSLTGKSLNGEAYQANYFVKHAVEEQFDLEKHSVQKLIDVGLDGVPQVDVPVHFFNKQGLIFSILAEGLNAKWVLRKALTFPFASRLVQSTYQQCSDYGEWLACFHLRSESKDGRSMQLLQSNPIHQGGLNRLLYPSKMRVIDSLEPEVLINKIREYLETHKSYDTCGHIHGDFGLQNIVVTEGSFQVVDWENFHLGHHLEDCVDFVTNALIQVRYAPFKRRFIRTLLNEFLAAYQKNKTMFPAFSGVVILMAISNIYKRQEWSGRDFSLLNKIFYLPALRKTAKNSYRQLTRHEFS